MKPARSGNNSTKKEGQKDFRGGNRWKNNRNRDREKVPQNNLPVFKCELCGENIKELHSAIALQGSNNPAHFDCIIEKIKKENPVGKDEKVVYLGSGNFGIVKAEKNNIRKDFKIVKKIEMENRDEKPDWRTVQIRVK